MHEEPCDSDVDGLSCACDPACAEANLRANSQNNLFFVDSLRISESIDDTETWWFTFIIMLLALAIVGMVLYFVKQNHDNKKAAADGDEEDAESVDADDQPAADAAEDVPEDEAPAAAQGNGAQEEGIEMASIVPAAAEVAEE
jgi:hypothetical protein